MCRSREVCSDWRLQCCPAQCWIWILGAEQGPQHCPLLFETNTQPVLLSRASSSGVGMLSSLCTLPAVSWGLMFLSLSLCFHVEHVGNSALAVFSLVVKAKQMLKWASLYHFICKSTSGEISASSLSQKKCRLVTSEERVMMATNLESFCLVAVDLWNTQRLSILLSQD